MAAHAASLRITAAYRQRLLRLYDLAAQTPWTVRVDNIDGTGAVWIAAAVERLTVLQGAGAQLAAGYAAAYVAAETASAPGPVAVDDSAAGEADDGRPLTVALAAALIAVKAAVKRGYPARQALRFGQNRADLIAATATAHAPRVALASALEQDDRVVGWRRVTRGGCGACLAAATNRVETGKLEVHPHCQCTAEPVVDGAPDTFMRPTGRETFFSWPAERQDALLGEDKAALIRAGEVPFERLIAHQHMAIAPDGIVERALVAL